MILFELTGREDHPSYQELEISNGNRQYDFLQSIVVASLSMGRPFLSQQIVKALNQHAICCLHTNAGEYRPCPVRVGDYEPPAHYRVQALMDDFVNLVNRNWEQQDPVFLATFVLWKINHIHPFINGNGRTARAACYFALCVKIGGLLPGARILPELLRHDDNRKEHVRHLKHADKTLSEAGQPDLAPLHSMISRLLIEQLASAEQLPTGNGASADDMPDGS